METSPSEQRARMRAHAFTGLLWHIGAFVIINGFFWLLDGFTDDRFTWAYWITAAWGFALAFHVHAWMIDGRQIEDRRAAKYLAEERARTESVGAHGETAGSDRN